MQGNEADIGGVGLSMDTLTQNRGLEWQPRDSNSFPRNRRCRWRRSNCGRFSAQGQDRRFPLPVVRRACIFVGTAALTAGGCYEMYEVLQVGGVTSLEWMVLVLFVLLFAWIAFSFMSALAGFAVLLFRARDPLGIDPSAPLPPIGSRNAMLLPTYNEDPDRIMARLRAMYESVEETGRGASFDWFVLSDTTDPVDLDRRREMLSAASPRARRAANVFYRHRPQNTARKSGNIEDWIKRFGAGYDHMIILDADSLMTGDTIVRLARAMEATSEGRPDPDASDRRQRKNLVCQAAAVLRPVVRPADRCGHRVVAWLRRQLLGP